MSVNETNQTSEAQRLKRFAFTLRLREGTGEAYDKAHRDIWAEMQEMLKRGGVREYSIFRRESLLLLTLKAVDFEATWRYLRAIP